MINELCFFADFISLEDVISRKFSDEPSSKDN